MSGDLPEQPPRRRRKRYSGTHPRRFEDKYKELDPASHPETVAKVIASGKTPAGQHLPIMVAEILEVLDLAPGQRCVDCTLGYGGHAREILRSIQPGGVLLALDRDPVELERAEARLRSPELPPEALIVRRFNFAGLACLLVETGWTDGADAIVADLGVSSMQYDNPARGFSYKHEGPLDMRMDPRRGVSAGEWIARATPQQLAAVLWENADEPRALSIAEAIAGRNFSSTRQLRDAVLAALPPGMKEEQQVLALRRVFQALRIEVNDEFGALDAFLASLPFCLRPGGRVAILTFHSGEDRRVKKALLAGFREGTYESASREVIRAGREECGRNPRASSAKLRWARRRQD